MVGQMGMVGTVVSTGRTVRVTVDSHTYTWNPAMLTPADASFAGGSRTRGRACTAAHHSFMHVFPAPPPALGGEAPAATADAAVAAEAAAPPTAHAAALRAPHRPMWVASGRALSLRASPLGSAGTVTCDVSTVVPSGDDAHRLLLACPPSSVSELGSVVTLSQGYTGHGDASPIPSLLKPRLRQFKSQSSVQLEFGVWFEASFRKRLPKMHMISGARLDAMAADDCPSTTCSHRA